MSQKKVDYYKEQKRNRAEIMRKEKRNRRLGALLAIVIVAALVGWFGYMIVQNARSASDGATKATELETTDLDEYFSQVDTILNGDEEAEHVHEEGEEHDHEHEEGEETVEDTGESTSEEVAD